MRILIVEDNEKIAKPLERGLKQESFAVDLALDGQQGFDLAATEDYDVIVLDLMLPKMDGIALCKKLRQEEKNSTPILMLTAKGQIEDRVEGLNCGADDYLAKPFSFKELLARIKALARRPKNNLSPVLKTESLSLNTNSFEVKREGKQINLSKKEFSLLEYLLRNKGRILTKDQIISHVWNFDADILPNTVEVYIGYLRKKIDKAFKGKKPLIKTIRGFGYKIKEV
jgi:two-component system, OmpR family, response regulator